MTEFDENLDLDELTPEENEKLFADGFPRCPDCGDICQPIYDNVGFQPPDPTHYEISGYECKRHGLVSDPIFYEKKDE